MSQALYTVSLYDTLGPDAIEYIINHASLPCVATSLPHIPTLLQLKARLPSLKIIISLDQLDEGDAPGQSKSELLASMAQQVGVRVYSIQQVEALGESIGPIKFRLPKPTDIITINYTSGTTGPPKGVLLTHRAAVAAATTSLCTAEQSNKDVALSYLPLAHIYGRLCEQGAMWGGGAIGYFHGNPLELVDDLKLIRPTSFNSVPRLWNRFGGLIRAATVEQSGVKGALSRHVVETKKAYLKEADSASATNKHMLYDHIWGRKVTAAIGLERVKTMVSGSAPLDPSLHTFLRVVFGNHFIQGYGMTETYGVGLAQAVGDLSTSNCGAVAVTAEMCLLSVPDMDYLVTDKPEPRGELLIRSNTLFSGYYKNDEETSKSMTLDGFFKTGDICSIDSRGRFRIIDRRKNVLKLAQGEYISPERIENVYMSHLTYLAQAYVHGDSTEVSLVAILGVQPDLFAPFASRVLGRTIEPTDLRAVEAACKETKVKKAVVSDLDKVGRKSRFNGYERVKAVSLYLEPFTVENELLTPT
jgi:long-chain acyl-CoA synthetase